MSPRAPNPARIVGVGAFVPEVRVAAEAAAGSAGMSAVQLRGEVGYEARHQPEGDVSPWHLLVGATRDALADARLGAGDLDLLVTVGRNRLDYLNWATGLSVAKEVGATRAHVLDMMDYTGGTLLAGLRVAMARFAADSRYRTALVVVQQRASDLAEHKDPKDRLLFALGDGGGAVVLRRGEEGAALLGHAFAQDGKGSKLLGLRVETVDEGPNPDDFFDHRWAMAKYVTLRDPERFLADFADRAARRVPQVVGEALRRSGVRLDEAAAVQAGYLWPAVEERVREALGVGARLRRHNAHGMLGGAELAFALRAVRADAALRGKPVVLAHAGTPADFGALVLRP